MKNTIVLLTIIFTSIIFSQVDTSFNGLRGYEDLDGNTQLFYQNVSDYSILRKEDFYMGEHRKDIFHFNVNNYADSLFLINGFEFYNPFPATGHIVSDFEFVDNTLTDFYQCGDGVSGSEPYPIVLYNRDYNNISGLESFGGETQNLEITKVDSCVNVYVHTTGDNTGVFEKISDGNYALIQTTRNFNLVSVDRNNPNIMYVENDDGNLFKSIDTGATFYIVDSSSISNYWYYNFINRYFLYDSDGMHIYRVLSDGRKSQLFVSNNNGELNSWGKIFESEMGIYIANDELKSGLIYYANGNNIYESLDYGITFHLFTHLNTNISGLYKKPNSNLIYATTSHSLLEINSDSIKVLKYVIDYENLSYYPLHVGDKWWYKKSIKWMSDIEDTYFTKEIIGKEILKNGFEYYKIKETNTNFDRNYFERIETTTGMLYRNEYEFDAEIVNLNMEYGETIKLNTGSVINYSSNGSVVFQNKVYDIKNYESACCEYRGFSLINNIGSLYQSKIIVDAAEEYDTLVGGIINGVIYGDTTKVGVSEQLSFFPKEFSLSQNYPNPFNPSTTIKYSIPSIAVIASGAKQSSKIAMSSDETWTPRNDNVNVTLKIYDILGREVATLVNKEQKPGNYEVQFDASNLTSGIYFYKLQSPRFSASRKMILVK